ncbi:orotidine 5'-phosphate decarboxylase [Candidatus Bathyarchaeota archaeon A05DMB-2]|nr:orotidine 5'-phosphate decarboxylase [Candidatus Bathyarchaeota archaeon A05DMB-2]
MEDSAKKNGSSIVLALDFPFHAAENRGELLFKAQNVLELAGSCMCAVKINHHLVLPLGTFDGVQQLVNKIHEKGLLAIIDCKVNDIGATNQVIAEYYYAAGFDALIANPFVGWEEGLKPVFDVALKQQRGVILLGYMSHKGAGEGYGQLVCDAETGKKTPQYIAFAKKALKWDADGVVVGATYPEKIREIHEVLRENVPIYSPGIGAQGGAAETALKAGARYLIVGREITLSENPSKVAEKLKASIKRVE